MFTNLDIKTDQINLKDLLRRAEKTIILLTVDHWQDVISNSIIAGANKADLITMLLSKAPYIGFSEDGYVAIHTGEILPAKLWAKLTWVDNLTIGTYPDSKIVALTMDTTIPIADAIWEMVTNFWTITVADITNIAWTKVAHGLSVKNTGNYFCMDTLKQLTLSDTHVFFGLIKDSGFGIEVIVDGHTTRTGIMTIEGPNSIEVSLEEIATN